MIFFPKKCLKTQQFGRPDPNHGDRYHFRSTKIRNRRKKNKTLTGGRWGWWPPGWRWPGQFVLLGPQTAFVMPDDMLCRAFRYAQLCVHGKATMRFLIHGLFALQKIRDFPTSDRLFEGPFPTNFKICAYIRNKRKFLRFFNTN